MENVEEIEWESRKLAYIIRGTLDPVKTTFITPNTFNLQIGFIVYPGGSEITRHTHVPVTRHIVGTSEVLLIKKGHCYVDIYNDEREKVTTRELFKDDVIAFIAGGHGFRMIDDTVIMEIKQGPYSGINEKERF